MGNALYQEISKLPPPLIPLFGRIPDMQPIVINMNTKRLLNESNVRIRNAKWGWADLRIILTGCRAKNWTKSNSAMLGIGPKEKENHLRSLFIIAAL